MEQDIQDDSSVTHIDAIKQSHKKEQQKLQDLHEQISSLQEKIRSIQSEAKVVEQHITAYETVIKLELEKQPSDLGESYSFTPDNPQAEDDDEYDEDEVQQGINIEYFKPSHSSSDPMDMLRPDFRGLALNEVAFRVLEESGVPMTAQNVAEIAYNTETEEELKRAKGSIGATLRNGVDEKDTSKSLWFKIARGVFVSKKGYFASVKDNEEQQRRSDIKLDQVDSLPNSAYNNPYENLKVN